MRYTSQWITVLLALILSAMPQLTSAQTTPANVTVNAAASNGVIPTTAFGVNTAAWNAYMLDADVPSLLRAAGATALRYPGGSTADVYHWQTNTSTTNSGQYIYPGANFDAFMGVAQQAGESPIITVNYGSNADGTAGGDPNEAAAWVDYANNTQHYGVKYWEIGNEVYGNGEYGSQWETDDHADHSPTAYGTNALQFITAMKAKDSTIKVGVALVAPGQWPDGQSPDWNSNVLQACGSSIDFVIVHWYPQGPGSESDAGLLGSTASIAGMVSTLQSEINQYCGANAPNVQILVTETNSVSSNPGKQTLSVVNSLFLADDYMDWLENGVQNVSWWDLHNGPTTSYNNLSASLYGTATYGDYGLLSAGMSPEPATDTPLPSYYGLEMLSHLGIPGDTMISATADQPLLAVHAVKQAGGGLALLLINKSPDTTYAANIAVNGYTPASSGVSYFYGENSTAITAANVATGASFSMSVPPYSLTTVNMTAAPTPLALSISNVAVSNITPTSATITWTTNNASSGTVNYGTSSSYTAATSGAGGVTSHTATLTNLSSSMTYHYDVASTDGNGSSATSSDATFQTAAAPPPALVISNVAVSKVTPTSASITWTTSKAASSVVNYGQSSSYGSIAEKAGEVVKHTVNLTGLNGSTVYHFDVASTDANGNASSSSDATFETAPTPIAISSVVVSNITANSATITWTTNNASSGSVNYGAMMTVGSTSTGANGVTSHSVTLTNLKSSTRYYFQVSSTDANGSSAQSRIASFKTPAAPVVLAISDVGVTRVEDTMVMLHWRTNTASTATVQYGISSAYTSSAGPGMGVRWHWVLLSNLNPSTTYHFNISASSAASGSAATGDAQFTTAAPPHVRK